MKQLAGNVIIENGKILLIYRKDETYWESQHSQGESCSTSNLEGCWGVPGGKVKEDGSPTEAAVREAKEEIGLEVKLERPFYTGEFQHENQIFEWSGYISSIDGMPKTQEDKFEELKWFSEKELKECEELAPNIRMVESGLRRLLD